MKTILCTVAVAIATAFTFNASAQIPDNGVWPAGVTFTDLNGTDHDIDAILDAGKPVFIDAFADWCAPCWNYHQSHALEDLHNQYGPAGTDELVVLGIESDASTPASNISNAGTGEGDWTNGISYPQANDDNIAGIINQSYYPTIIKICPDRTVTEVGQASKAVLYSSSQVCEAPANTSNDPRLIVNESQEFFCSGGTAQTSVVLQNFGTDALTDATIEVFDGATSVATKNWTGNLASYEVETVTIGNVSPTSTTTYDIKITSSNDETSNDELSATISPAPELEVGETSHAVTFDLNIDDYASEVGIIFDEGPLPAISFLNLHNNTAGNPSSVLGFSQVGTYADGTNSIQETWTVNNEGCHYAVFIDEYGDGYVYNNPSSTIEIQGSGGSSLSVDPDFESGTSKVFDVKFIGDLGLNTENIVSQFNLYPNPTTNIINVDFNIESENNVSVSILNTVGQEVDSKEMNSVSGTQTIQFDTSDLEAGMYLVKVKTGTSEQIKRISVVK